MSPSTVAPWRADRSGKVREHAKRSLTGLHQWRHEDFGGSDEWEPLSHGPCAASTLEDDSLPSGTCQDASSPHSAVVLGVALQRSVGTEEQEESSHVQDAWRRKGVERFFHRGGRLAMVLGSVALYMRHSCPFGAVVREELCYAHHVLGILGICAYLQASCMLGIRQGLWVIEQLGRVSACRSFGSYGFSVHRLAFRQGTSRLLLLLNGAICMVGLYLSKSCPSESSGSGGAMDDDYDFDSNPGNTCDGYMLWSHVSPSLAFSICFGLWLLIVVSGFRGCRCKFALFKPPPHLYVPEPEDGFVQQSFFDKVLIFVATLFHP